MSNEEHININEEFSNLKERLKSVVSEAQSHERKGDYTTNGMIDSAKIFAEFSGQIKLNEKGKLQLPNWMVGVKNPHYYKRLVEEAWDQHLYQHDTQANFDLKALIEEYVAEELLHGVPTLEMPTVTDSVYGVAFFFDTKLEKPIVQCFFAYHDENDSKELKIDVTENPSRILKEEMDYMDRTTRDM